MMKAKFEIVCAQPEIIRDAIAIGNTHPVSFAPGHGTLVFEIEAETLKELMKISYSVCNRIQLSMETVDKFL